MLVEKSQCYLYSLKHFEEPNDNPVVEDVDFNLDSVQDNNNNSSQNIDSQRSRFNLILSHLKILSGNALRNFFSQIKQLREVSIDTQSVLITQSLDKLVIITLALIDKRLVNSLGNG